MFRPAGIALAICLSSTQAAALDPTTAIREYGQAIWTEQNGLDSSFIWAITQDHDGYLWLGTAAGLIRFDGIRFVRFTEVPAGAMRALVSARDGSLWIGVGAVVMRLLQGQATRFEDGLPISINMLLEDHDGVMWAGGRGGLSRFDGGQWRPVRDAGLPDETIIGLYEDRDSTLWVATLSRLYKRGVEEHAFISTPSAFIVRALTEDRAGQLWAAGTQQAIGTVRDTLVNQRLRAWADVNAWRVIRDSHGSLWVATLGRGVLRLTNAHQNNDLVVEHYGTESGLSSDVVRALFEDREGNIWIGTQQGLNRLSDNLVQTITSTTEVGQPVNSITTDRGGAVWIGTDNGLYRFLGNERRRFTRADGLPTLVVKALHVDRRGVVWAATDYGGLARFENDRFTAEALPPEAGLRRLWSMTSDDEGALWLCELDRGVFRWKTGTLTSFIDVPEVGRKSVTTAFTDRAGRVWIGFSDGTLVSFTKGQVRAFGRREGLIGGSIRAIYEDSRGILWVGSENGIRKLVDGSAVSVPALERSAGDVRSIAEDDEHHIWLGLGTGLLRLDPNAQELTLLDASDGVRGVPGSLGGSPTSTVSADGVLWFVTSSGVARVNPRSLKQDRRPSPVRIEGIFVDGRALPADDRLRLPALTSRIQIDYTGLRLTSPEKVRFTYRLEGFDHEWIDAGTRRQAFYTNLLPGDYRFIVAADDVAKEQAAVWRFTILPAFYQTKWFYAVVLSASGLLVLAAWQIRVRQVQRTFSRVLAERARVAREIHDTLLQSLVGVAFQFDAVALEVEESVDAGLERLGKLRGQIESAIEEARQSIFDLRSPVQHGRDLPSALRQAGQSLGGAAVRFELTVNGTPRAHSFRFEEALLRIAREAISNAARHGSASRIRVELDYGVHAVSMRVVDDGRGFDLAATSRIADHWGLATMRERAEDIGGHINIISRPGYGTEIEIVAPGEELEAS